MFVKKLLGLVDLSGQVWAAAAVGVVEEHELTVFRAHLVLVQGTFPIAWMSANSARISIFRRGGIGSHVRELKDQRGFTTCHTGLETSISVGQ